MYEPELFAFAMFVAAAIYCGLRVQDKPMTIYCHRCGCYIGLYYLYGRDLADNLCERCKGLPANGRELDEEERRAMGGVTGEGKRVDWATEELERIGEDRPYRMEGEL